MGLREHQQETYSKGKEAEKRFILAAEKDGYVCTKPNDYEDRWEHWDVRVTKNGKSGLVDVKDKEIHKFLYNTFIFQNGKCFKS